MPGRGHSWIGATGTLVVSAAAFAGRVLPSVATSVLRDWLPAPLMLFVYWQVGAFATIPHESFQQSLRRWDARFLRAWPESLRRKRTLAIYLEFAYLLCYALIPLGVGVLYLEHLRNSVNHYWLL